MMLIHAMLVDVDELAIRNEQAMQRTTLVVPVLEPAVDRLVQLRSSLRTCQRELSEVWADGEAERWMNDLGGVGG